MMLQNTPTPSTSRDGSSVFCDVASIFHRILSCIFFSWVQFKQALDEFMKVTDKLLVIFRKESNTSDRVASSRLRERDGPMKYEFVVYECTFGGKPVSKGAGFRNKG